jgi:hypothetical protein
MPAATHLEASYIELPCQHQFDLKSVSLFETLIQIIIGFQLIF